jgi:hypothetical protein
MAFAEDPRVFLSDFGQDCTLAGASLRAIVSTETVQDFESGAITQSPSALLITTAALNAAAGQVFNDGTRAYTVRQVLLEPPDGVLTRLILSRS